MFESGLIIEEVIDFCKDAKEYGVDVLNISRRNIITVVTLYEVAPVDIENGFNVEDGACIRKETGMFTMPCGHINTPEFAEKILEDDKVDLIIMARTQLFVIKIKMVKWIKFVIVLDIIKVVMIASVILCMIQVSNILRE